eukprot:g45856.t1
MLLRGLAKSGISRVSTRVPALVVPQRSFASEVGPKGGASGEIAIDAERKKVYDSWAVDDPTLIAQVEKDRAQELAERETFGPLGDPSKFESRDNNFEHYMNQPKGDPTNRFYTYAILGTTQAMTLIAGRFLTTKIGGLLWMSEHVAAAGSVEVDFTKLTEGDTMAVNWRGRTVYITVYIRWRTPVEIERARAGDSEDLKDPENDSDRCQRPEILIVSGVCTHLGCIPLTGEGEWGGWFCPCHGSHYDLSGRIRKGPAPLNLEVPPYTFLSDKLVKLG